MTEEHWVNSPHLDKRQKIRMFDDMLQISHRVGQMKERERILDIIKLQLEECRNSDNPWEKEFVAGLQLMEGMVNDDLDQLKN